MSDQGYDDGTDYGDPELAAQEEAARRQLAELADTRNQVQTQTRELEGDIGGFRAEQGLAWEAAHTASVELATAQGGDFYAPDVGQRIAPNGTVTYDFDAHLHARGIDLDAGVGIPPATVSTVRWLRQSDGAQVAQLVAVESGDDSAIVQAMSPESANVRQAQLSAVAGRNSGDIAVVQAFATSVAHPAGHVAQIIRDDGTSGFVQTRGATNTFLSWGQVNAGGGVTASSPDVAVGRVSIGLFSVVLTGGNYLGPFVAVVNVLASGFYAAIVSFGSGSFRYEIRASTTGALADASACFMCIASVAP
jgi:hypothetical protein